MCVCVVYAKNAKEARRIAQKECLDECHESNDGGFNHTYIQYWTDPHKTTCQRLLSSVYKHTTKPKMFIAKTIDG